MSGSKPATPTPTGVTPPTNNAAYNILARAHSPSKATTLFTDKLKHKPLLLQPSHGAGSSSNNKPDKRALRRHIRLRKTQYRRQHQKPRPLSAKEKRQLGIFDLSPEEIKYELYRGLNRLWRGYIKDVLGLVSSSNNQTTTNAPSSSSPSASSERTINQSAHGSLIASADFHGMNVEITRCVDVGRVGLKGIVVRETRSTFVIITPRDKLTTVLKRGALFRVVIPLFEPDGGSTLDDGNGDGNDDDSNAQQNETGKDANTTTNAGPGPIKESLTRQVVVELHGSQLERRPVERAVRKFKWHTLDYL